MIPRSGIFIAGAIFLGVLALAWPAAATADLAAGARAYEDGDYAAALAAWQPLAAAGDPHALFNLGQMYRLGRGVKADISQAETYYRLAAEKGHVGAQANLGTLYYFAKPGGPYVADAIKWWEQAALGGDQRARYLLGVTYFNGKEAPRDPVKAYGWMRLAAESGLTEAVDAEKTMIRALSVEELAAGHAFAKAVTAQTAPAEQSPGVTPTSAARDNVGGYMVQVGAFRDKTLAENTAHTLIQAHGAALGVTKAEFVPLNRADGPPLHRLLFGPFADRATAVAACDQLKNSGQACFVTRR